jgi:hypothetical protein
VRAAILALRYLRKLGRSRTNCPPSILSPSTSRPADCGSIENKLPSIYTFSEYIEAGGLIAYTPNYHDLFRRAASYVDVTKPLRDGRLLRCLAGRQAFETATFLS